MIRAFRDADTRALFEGRAVRRFQAFRKAAERNRRIIKKRENKLEKKIEKK